MTMTVKINKEDICNRLGIESFAKTTLAKLLSRIPVPNSSRWIAGGSIRRTIAGISLDSDIDFFFKDEKALSEWEDEAIAKGASLLSKNDKNRTYILPTEIAEGKADKGFYLPELKLQAINFQYFGSPEAVIDSFDFTICQFAFDGTHIYMGYWSLYDLARKRLVPHRVTYGVSTIRRIIKYCNQGYTVCSGGLATILEEVAANPGIIQAEMAYID
jgi:hypothetical protein